MSSLISINKQAVYSNVKILKKYKLDARIRVFCAIQKQEYQTEGLLKIINCDETELYLEILPGYTSALVHNWLDEKRTRKFFHNLPNSVSFMLRKNSYVKLAFVFFFQKKLRY